MTEQFFTEDVLPKLREWFEFNCGTGCTLEQLKQILLEAGYRENDVDRFLKTQFALWSGRNATVLYDADPVGGPDQAIERLWGRLDVLNSFNQISLGDKTVWMLARNPRCGMYFIPHFLSDEECQGLISETDARLSESMVIDEGDGAQVKTTGRSSRGALIRRSATELVRRIESRISKLTALPVSHGEDLQILHYGVGGEYRPHFDYFDPATKGGTQVLAHRSQRLATVIMYLSDVEAGGGTRFHELSLEFTPQKGAAVLFASIGRDRALLQASLHSGCPVTSGEKWIATKWILVSPHVTAGGKQRARR